MIRPQDLLDHATALVGTGTEVDTRRAVSAAYYALFHTLTAAGAGFFSAAGPGTVAQAARAFNHGTMRRVCAGYLGPDAEAGLAEVAGAFVDLQDARHRADYDLTTTFGRVEGTLLVGLSASALQLWPSLEQGPQARAFLTALLLGDRWTRRG